jgi:pilus assembly protein Flp/PilA
LLTGVHMKTLIRRLLANQRGATALEYALMAFVLGVGIIGGLTSLGTTLSDAIGDVASYF